MRRKQRWAALELLVSMCSRKTEILQIYGIVIVSRRICHCYSIVSRVSNESNVSSIRSIKQCKHFMWWCYLHLLLNVCKWLFCIPHSPPHRPNNVCDNCIAIVETVWTSCSLVISFFREIKKTIEKIYGWKQHMHQNGWQQKTFKAQIPKLKKTFKAYMVTKITIMACFASRNGSGEVGRALWCWPKAIHLLGAMRPTKNPAIPCGPNLLLWREIEGQIL